MDYYYPYCVGHYNTAHTIIDLLGLPQHALGNTIIDSTSRIGNPDHTIYVENVGRDTIKYIV
jgi:hypothetical protein